MGLKTKATLTLNEAFQRGWDQFGGYSKSVDSYLLHKIRHTYGVLQVGQDIVTVDPSLHKLTAEQLAELEASLILHDLERFGQVNQERILSGKEREHGDEAAKTLLDDEYWARYPEVILAVKYHNKYSLDALYSDKLFVDLDPQQQQLAEVYAKLVRDADKLQNMKYMVFDIDGFLKIDKKYIPEPTISEENMLSYKQGNMLDRGAARTMPERILCYVSWQYDLYFEGTKQQLASSGFFERVYDFLVNLGVEKNVLDRLGLV